MIIGDMVNRRGFTLIELLAVIVIIAIITVIVAPSVLTLVDKSEEASYQMLVKNIVIASKNYYEECEYGDLSSSKYDEYECTINEGNYIYVTLRTLANTGFLTVNDTNYFDEKVVLDPRNNNDISDCTIKIIKNKVNVPDSNGIVNTKITYMVESYHDNDDVCPTIKEYGSDS